MSRKQCKQRVGIERSKSSEFQGQEELRRAQFATTDIPCVPAPRITTPRDQSTPTASAKRFRLLPKSMLSICLSGSWCGWNMGYTGALSAALRCRRLRVPTEIQTERADDRPVFSWTRTAVHLPAWAFRRSAPLRPGGRDHLSTAAALLTGPSTISMTSTDWGLQRSAVSSTVELAGIFGVIWTQSSTRATTCQVPHTRGSLFLPSTATCQDCAPARSKYCCGARQISRIAIPPVRNRPWCY